MDEKAYLNQKLEEVKSERKHSVCANMWIVCILCGTYVARVDQDGDSPSKFSVTNIGEPCNI